MLQRSNSHNCRERGVALIMALGMVAIIAAWASTAAYEDMVSIRRISNIQDNTRATMASESAYELVKIYLKLDAEDNNTDSLDEDWAQPMPPFPVDEGFISATIIDANRYYNLNDLIDDKGAAQQKNIAQVKALFYSLEIEPSLVEPLVDWLDANDSPMGNTDAEDNGYYDKKYHVKNSRLDNWSELKLIMGFDAKTLEKLKNVATVRPSTHNGQSRININTAPAEVLMALFPNMTQLDTKNIEESRPFENLNEVKNEPWAKEGDFSRLSVSSDAFMVRTHASFGRANVREEYLLSRVGKNTTLIWRERLGWQL